jgi:hypothetical protein
MGSGTAPFLTGRVNTKPSAIRNYPFQQDGGKL